MDIKSEFEKTVQNVKSGGKNDNLTDNDRLNMYKYYKQATEGDCNTAQPWAVQFEARAKWDAWNSVRGMPKEEAMQKYIDLYHVLKN